MTDATPRSGADSPRDDWPFSRVDGADRGRGEIPPPNSSFAARAMSKDLSEPDPKPADPAAVDPASADEATPLAPTPLARTSRRRPLLIAGAVIGVLVVGGGAVALSGVLEGEPVAAPSPSVITIPSPTPTVEPVAREPRTAFLDALPSTVLQYALTGVAEYPALVAAGALEGHQLEYSDGGAAAVTVVAGQFETPEAASAAASSLLAVADPAATPQTGAVEVAGQPAGAWTVTTAPDGAGVAVWTNGTAVFGATGPAGAVLDFYSAFPL